MQVKEKKEPERLKKGPFPWQMILFTAVLTVAGICSLLLEKPDVSEMEQRNLAQKPQVSWQSWFSGTFSKEFDAYYADTFPLRDFLVAFSNGTKESLGIRYDDIRILGGADAPVETPDEPVSQPDQALSQSDASQSQSVSSPQQGGSDSSLSSEPEENDVGVNKSGIFIYKGMGMSLFGGNESVGKVYADNINAYHEVFGDSVRVFDMVVPTSAEFYLPEKYKELSNSEKDAIESIYRHLADGVTGVDAYSAIEQHTDEYLYFNTDHHWTGARRLLGLYGIC